MRRTWVRQFVLFLGGWLLVGLSALAVVGIRDPIQYLVVMYVGFLLAVEYSEPPFERPVWHRRLDWVSVAGLLVFVYVAVDWVLTVTGVSLL
jgi:hypothetical protein